MRWARPAWFAIAPRTTRGDRDVEHRQWRVRPLLPLLLAASLGVTDLPYASAERRSYDEVQAAFLFRFLFFTRDVPRETPDGTLCLGVLGPISFERLLDEVDGRTVRGRIVNVRRFKRPRDVDVCELLFISPQIDGGPELAARSLRHREILTVSTSDGFARHGGMIELTLHHDRMRFDVNRTNARVSGVYLDAELLEVARRIYP